LTLVAAPAGYGKTTLLSEWRAQMRANHPVAWLSLDEGDNNLLRFLLYLTAAFDSVQPDLLLNTSLLYQSPQLPPIETICTTLLNEISSFDGDIVLVLDDYHVISNPEIQVVLTFLLDHQLPDLHLVILTRADPALPLARLRARGQLTEIRAADLRFTLEEATAFLNEMMGLKLTPQEVSTLEARTEGWIAGLQLAALSMQGRADTNGFITAFSGSHQYIVDYLAEEVLTRQPESVRDFLLKTSILERLTGPLCEALTGVAGGQHTLEMLAASNLFLIPLDDERRWFRYHHLFADLLHSRLRSTAPEQLSQLHLRASAWFDQQKIPNESIEHALSAHAYEEARGLMSSHFPSWWQTENRGRILEWFKRFPDEFWRTEPWLCVVYAWMVWSQGKLSETEACLDCAQTALDALKASENFPTGDLKYEGLQAEILAFRAVITTQKNDPDQVIELADQALAAAPTGTPVISANALLAQQVAYRQKGQMNKAIESCFRALPLSRAADDVSTRVSVLHSLGVGLMIQGKLGQVIHAYKEGLRFAEAQGEIEEPGYDLIYFKLADVAYVRNELDQVEAMLREGFKRSQKNPSLWPHFYGKMLQIQLALARGDHRSAHRLQAEIEQLLEKIHGVYFEADLAAFVTMSKVLIGNLEGVRDWAQACQDCIQQPLDCTRLEPALQLAYVWEALDELDTAIQLAEQLETITSETGCQHLQLYAIIPQIKVWAKKGDLPKAQNCLSRALLLAQSEGYIRVFVDQGAILQEQLKIARKSPQNEASTAFIVHLLSAFGPETTQPDPMMDLLSQRELEVLGLIAAGHSNKEIGAKLFIAIGTVKRHTVNIFTKLDVKNRTEAVARARELGLI